MSARNAALLARGSKHACNNAECGKRFYDLNKLPTPCPYCGTMFVEPVKKPVEEGYSRPSRYKVYKLQQHEVPAEEPVPLADLPVIDTEEEEVEQETADEIPEIEDDEETLPAGIPDRGDA